ncbi:MAG: ABC transporter permease [Ferruginibacter sp.]|nr:ABC transporter permease [Cytophagales bacterium]
MLRNYLKIALRNLSQGRFYALLNIAGLTLGITGCLLIALYILEAVSYDRFHARADRIVLLQQHENSAGSGGKFAGELKARFTQVEEAVRLHNVNALIGRETVAHYEPRFYFADSTLFKVFSFALVEGDPATALKVPYGVVLSQRMAQKYFPNENPVGKFLRYNNRVTLNVTGVLRDLPETSHLAIDFLGNFANANELVGWDVSASYWGGQTLTYLLLTGETDQAGVEAQFPAFVKQTGDPNAAVWKLGLIPLRDIYLRTKLDGGVKAPNAIEYVYIFSTVAAFILLLACFNYVNLATARSATRAREVGVRKVVGAVRTQLVAQFLSESALFTFLAVGLALGLTEGLLPFFNQLAEGHFSTAALYRPACLGGLLAAALVLSLFTGGYPALVLSAFRPVEGLKGTLVKGAGNGRFRQALVVIQFSISVVMGVATLVVWEQLDYVNHKDLGYRREQVLTLDFRDAPDDLKTGFKREVQALAAVQSATVCSSQPGSGAIRIDKLTSEFVPPGAPDGGLRHLHTDADYLRTFGIELVEGRDFDAARLADRESFLINQAALDYFGWKSIAGKQLGYYTYESNPDGSYREIPVRGEVIGVFKDYHHADLKSLIAPMMISVKPEWAGQLAIRIRAGTDVRQTVRLIEAKWKQRFPAAPFEYGFLDEAFDRTYRTEIKTGRIFGLFATLAIVISCLGLFGLVAYTAGQRTKEIGIRKVLGASVSSLVGLLSKDFLRLILLANVVAGPLAYYAMHRWLDSFAYRIFIGWWTFALAGGGALAIALLTISVQAIKAAVANPVKSLRTE